ncbi:MAG: putative transcriptional regulator [Verrucomicrobiales bacterium]|jgi:putative transcriptional regulator
MLSTGRLLLASPGMHDVTFDRTVIFVIEHDEGGSMGLVLNRPSDMLVSDALPDFGSLANPDRLYLGGPVEQGTALVLAEPVDPAAPDMHFMHEGIGLLDLATERNPVQHLERARVFSGYAGWGPRQLESELRSGAWVVAKTEPTDLWAAADYQSLWAKIMARQGSMADFLSQYPEQPWLN